METVNEVSYFPKYSQNPKFVSINPHSMQDPDQSEELFESEDSFFDAAAEGPMDDFSLTKMQEYGSNLVDWTVTFVPRLILALIVVWVGFKIVTRLAKLIGAGLDKANLDIEITEFLKSIVTNILKVIVLALGASIIGIKMTALIGLLGAAVFAIGMALQGFMGNFASGLTILFLKPYKVGDWISVEDSFGRVKHIQIFSTTLETPNDKTLVIPNGQVTDNVITNYSSLGLIRLELQVSMPYAESFPRVKEVINGALKQSKYVKWDKDPLIGIETYDSHNIQLAIRPYINPNDYWEATFEIYGLIKAAFNANNIQAAYSEGVELGPIGA